MGYSDIDVSVYIDVLGPLYVFLWASSGCYPLLSSVGCTG